MFLLCCILFVGVDWLGCIVKFDCDLDGIVFLEFVYSAALDGAIMDGDVDLIAALSFALDVVVERKRVILVELGLLDLGVL